VRLRPRRRRVSLRKALFVLPNLFTLGATFCGFYSMLLASQAERPWDFWAAAWLIVFAIVLDGMDGRVARLTRTQSRFGLELDSLSDTVAFGVAPAWLVYHWGLSHLWPVGFLIAFAFAAATAIRLARFNVIAQDEGDPRYFVGLPSPMGAALIAGMVGVSSLGALRAPEGSQWLVAAVVLTVALLMVSNIRFHSFKKLRRSPRTFVAVGTLLGAVAYVSILTSLEAGLTAGVTGYVAFHLAGAAVHLERRLRGRRPVLDVDDDDDDLLIGLDDADDEREGESEVAEVPLRP
jgi:CDP-diacylglycerol---serine O-phosphatidyltransferase